MRWNCSLLLCLILLVAACSQQDAASTTKGAETQTPAMASVPANTEPEAATATSSFDINQYPTSEVALGAFPYISLPAGYSNKGFGQTNKVFARFPFWVNGEAHWVEGKFHGEIFAAEPGVTKSPKDLSRAWAMSTAHR